MIDMSDGHNGGPAFPTSNGGSPDDGMTLRDYFAAAALQGLLASYAGDKEARFTAASLSRFSYSAADGMLSERAK